MTAEKNKNPDYLFTCCKNINDFLSKPNDFHYSGTKQAYDYSYDGNGNLILDNNKAISAITYNYLNLPNQVTVIAKGTVTYTNDAGGNKLAKTTVDNTITPSKTTTTLYLGGTVYQNDTLQFISHEEGRTRWALHRYVNGSTKYGFEYDYFLKDHLGNTRMVLTQEKDTAQYIATMEAAYRATENQLFYNIPQSSYARSAVSGYPSDPTTNPNDSLARVNGNGPKTGPSILLKVMSGDVVDIATKSFYKSGGAVNPPNSTLTDIVNSLAGGLVTVTSASHGGITDFTNSSSPMYAAVNAFLPTNDPNTTGQPKAYLNWILLNDQFQGVNTYPQSGAIPVGSPDVLNTLAYSGIPITKNGYLYIWVSNETPGWDVFFDNLSIKQYTGPIAEENHFYPFGLTMAGISDQAAKPANYPVNKYLFSHQLLDDDLGLDLYQFKYRSYDPQIGRFIEIDPLAEKYPYNSPYAYAENKLGKGFDLEGLELFELNPVFFESNNVIEESPELESSSENVTPETQNHHLSPNGLKNDPTIEQARNAGFKQDGQENKMPLDKFDKATGKGEHGNHPNYNNEVARRLAEFREKNPNATDKEARDFVRNMVKDLKETINNNRGTKINDLFKPKITIPKDATNVRIVVPPPPPGLPQSPPAETPDPYKPTPKPPPPPPHKDDPYWT